uniref:Uncharacterized protein n=1 Tax=Ascaris lumbricoides TaxID=6252 RepID=A0A9J2PSJ6_ASCLU
MCVCLCFPVSVRIDACLRISVPRPCTSPSGRAKLVDQAFETADQASRQERQQTFRFKSSAVKSALPRVIVAPLRITNTYENQFSHHMKSGKCIARSTTYIMSGEISEELRIMMKEGIKSNLFPSYSTDTLNGRNTTKALLNVPSSDPTPSEGYSWIKLPCLASNVINRNGQRQQFSSTLAR